MRAVLAVLAGLIVVACGATQPATPSPTPAPSASASIPVETPPPTPGPSTSASTAVVAPAIATFEVAGAKRYRIELRTQDLVDHAAGLLAGEPGAAIPVGTVVRGGDGGVNAPWSWHIDPATLSFAEVTIEVCDGLPSHVEQRLVTSAQYCPWSAKVVALEPKAAP